MHLSLESIAQSLNYGDLPETWRVPDIGNFSTTKTLYDYQTDALQKAARALFLYYGKEHDWSIGEPQATNNERKRYFFDLYDTHGIANVNQYESRNSRRNGDENPVFRILSDYITPFDDTISYHNLINRMCFWMATGSGKTLVMVKLIEYLHHLIRHREIPPHNILILAPSEHLLGQIRRTVEEFNQTGLYIDLVPLREMHRSRQARIGDMATVYYHRSDNISDVQKDTLTNYRTYENCGKWYVLLDEAHKGGKEDSKRQAYYAVMAREGFLFNFSATFTDKEDIITTVKKYNLEEFVINGHGKNIFLNEQEYDAFRHRGKEMSHEERRKIVMKSLITFGYVSLRVKELREGTQIGDLYHLPLMLTLVNSVNTDVENERNDLWAFFQTLREVATGAIDTALFRDSKTELIDDWRNARLLFREDSGGIIETDETPIKKMTTADLREAVFLSRKKGALQLIRSGDNKELAFQLKNADSPFALIRIGDTSKWRNNLLAGFEETTALQEKSFFDELEQSSITVLMGSRSFFESWDSNRPNVINFINIGGSDAKKFIVQSVGRGVRIETLPNQRRRFAYLADSKEKQRIQDYHDKVQPPETLFLFATNRSAVKSVLKGLEAEKGAVFERLEGFEKAPLSKINNKDMPLLVPEYREEPTSLPSPFWMSEETLERLQSWFKRTSDSVYIVRDELAMFQINALRGLLKIENGIQKIKNGIQIKQGKDYALLPFLQNRLLAHTMKIEKVSDGVREIADEDIVHFREIRVRSEYVCELQTKIDQVKAGKASNGEMVELAWQLAEEKITQEVFGKRYAKLAERAEKSFMDLKIRKVLKHYYFPVILGDEKANYIQHIIKVASEINFLNALEEWLGKNTVPWDAWMFSKIDESWDNIHIPYSDPEKNECRRFLPDFVFWMCRGNEYRIVFVDPKGTQHTSAYHKIDGYQNLFEKGNGELAQFGYREFTVRVALWMFNKKSNAVPEKYRRFYIDQPERIFESL